MFKPASHKIPDRPPVFDPRISRDELVVVSFPGPDRSIRLEDLQAGRAVSRRYRNRRIGEFLKELDLTEGRSTGIPKILKVMAANGSPAPLFDTDDDRLAFVIRLPCHPLAGGSSTSTEQVTPQVGALLARMGAEMTRQAPQDAPGLADREHFRKAYQAPALELGLLEMTLPDKPNSRHQRYRLTALGQRWRETILKTGDA